MDEHYDVIVLGTGLSECILSGILSIEGKKVLHMDKNMYYGGESASLTPLSAVFEHFQRQLPDEKAMASFGRERDWNVDLIPKLLMADGKLVKILLTTGVTRYLEFKMIEGSYVYISKDKDGSATPNGKIHKIPANESEALKSNLMNLLEKRKFSQFLSWILEFDEKNPKTWKNFTNVTTMDEVYSSFGLHKTTIDFTGHAIALQRDESYRSKPFIETVKRAQIYYSSLMRYADQDKRHSPSPYLYCLYGLGELPQSFARLSAIYGGTYMLDVDVEVLVDENGKFNGVKSKDSRSDDWQIVHADYVIGDPTYFPGKIQSAGKVVRAICLLNHPIPNTDNANSVQIIVPASQLHRNSDIYICCVSTAHLVAPEGYYIAVVGATVETNDPEGEIRPLLEPLLGSLTVEPFFCVKEIYHPTDDGVESNVFITKSYDATTHFETTCQDIEDVYHRIYGKKDTLDLEKLSAKIIKTLEENQELAN